MAISFPLQLTAKGESTILIIVGALIGALIILSFVSYFRKKKKDREALILEQEEKKKLEQEKRDYIQHLKSKYDGDDGENLSVGLTWVGMTKEMLIDLYGRPSSRETKELKTKSQEILIYKSKNPSTRRKVSNKFVFEDDKLVSSDVKARPSKIWEIPGFRYN